MFSQELYMKDAAVAPPVSQYDQFTMAGTE